TRAIIVKENMKRLGWAGPIISAEHVHFANLPGLAGGHDEIVSSLAVEEIECYLGVLRDDVDRLFYRCVVVLIVQNDRRRFRHRQNARAVNASRRRLPQGICKMLDGWRSSRNGATGRSSASPSRRNLRQVRRHVSGVSLAKREGNHAYGENKRKQNKCAAKKLCPDGLVRLSFHSDVAFILILSS